MSHKRLCQSLRGLGAAAVVIYEIEQKTLHKTAAAALAAPTSAVVR